MSEFTFKCRACGCEKYHIAYGKGNGIYGPAGRCPIEGLYCAECHIRYAIIPPDPREVAEQEERKAWREELERVCKKIFSK